MGGRYTVYSPLAGQVFGEFCYSNAFDKPDAKRRAAECRKQFKAKGYARVGVRHTTIERQD